MTDELGDKKKHIGNKHSSEDVVIASQVGRLAGALMVDHPARHRGDPVPAGWHGAFFPGVAPRSNMRTDGQPKSGTRPRRRPCQGGALSASAPIFTTIFPFGLARQPVYRGDHHSRFDFNAAWP